MSLHSDQPHWRLIVPVRGGALGKSRLTSIEGHPLTEPDRRDLMMAMAADTVAAAVASGCGPVGVLTADGLVADLARSLGADVVIDQGRGLNPELYAALAPVAPASGVAVLLGICPLRGQRRCGRRCDRRNRCAAHTSLTGRGWGPLWSRMRPAWPSGRSPSARARRSDTESWG